MNGGRRIPQRPLKSEVAKGEQMGNCVSLCKTFLSITFKQCNPSVWKWFEGFFCELVQ